MVKTSDVNEATTLRDRGHDPQGRDQDPRGWGQEIEPTTGRVEP